MPDEWIVAYNRNTGRKLPNRVPRSYLKVFPHLTETPASKRRKPRPPRESTTEATATPAPRADNTDLQEESHAAQSD